MTRIQLLFEEYKQQSIDWWNRDKYVEDKFIRCIFLFSLILAVTAGVLGEYSDVLLRAPNTIEVDSQRLEGIVEFEFEGDHLVPSAASIDATLTPADVSDDEAPQSVSSSSPQNASPFGLLIAFFIGYFFLALFARCMVISLVKDVHYRDGSQWAILALQKEIEENIDTPDKARLPREIFEELAEKKEKYKPKYEETGHLEFKHPRKLCAYIDSATQVNVGIAGAWRRWNQQRLSKITTFKWITSFYWTFYLFACFATVFWIALLIYHVVMSF